MSSRAVRFRGGRAVGLTLSPGTPEAHESSIAAVVDHRRGFCRVLNIFGASSPEALLLSSILRQ